MKKIVSILICLFIASCIYAQSADVITKILESDEVCYGEICYLSAIRQNLIPDDASYGEAVSALYDEGQIPMHMEVNEPVCLINLAYIYSRLWPDLQGGSLMYKLTRGSPRYTFKLFKADGVLPHNADPYDTVNGFEALNILTLCMLEYGTDDECMGMDIE
jgi:hypothetical protein